MLKKLLSHPLTRGLDVDDPRTTEARRRIIREKDFLRRLYDEWFSRIRDELPLEKAPIVELGSGAGHLEKFVPGLIKSEILPCPHVDVVLDGGSLPFSGASLSALVMIDVFHHLPRPRAFLKEAARCLVPGGLVIMIEPWVTPWSRFVYRHLHSEPFAPEADAWEFPPSGPLSGANTALPWIVFSRDRDLFQREFPRLQLERLDLMMPLLYLLSGGVSYKSFQPGWTFSGWRSLEKRLEPLLPKTALFARITLKRTGAE